MSKPLSPDEQALLSRGGFLEGDIVVDSPNDIPGLCSCTWVPYRGGPQFHLKRRNVLCWVRHN